MSTPIGTPDDIEQELRRYAVGRLRKKREFQAHLLAYLTVNAFLVAIWVFIVPGGFFWPVFPIFGWGIGLAFHAWDTFTPATPSEEKIRREMARLRDR